MNPSHTQQVSTKLVLILLFSFLAFSTLIYLKLIKPKMPNNIYSFTDIGTFYTPQKTVEVNKSNHYGQSFVSNFDNLFMMSIFIPKQHHNSQQMLEFHLKKTSTDPNDLVMLKWNFSQLQFKKFKKNNFYIMPPDPGSTSDNFHFHFEFPVIEHAKNESFYFYFSSPDSKIGKGISLGYWPDRKYYDGLRQGSIHHNHIPGEGFLAFRTYHTWRGNIIDVFQTAKSRLLKDTHFLIFYFGTLLLTVFLFFLFSRKSSQLTNIRNMNG